MRRASSLVSAWLLLAVTTFPATAGASTNVGSLIVDPWLPLGAVVERAIAEGWVCVGLPHPAETTAGELPSAAPLVPSRPQRRPPRQH